MIYTAYSKIPFFHCACILLLCPPNSSHTWVQEITKHNQLPGFCCCSDSLWNNQQDPEGSTTFSLYVMHTVVSTLRSRFLREFWSSLAQEYPASFQKLSLTAAMCSSFKHQTVKNVTVSYMNLILDCSVFKWTSYYFYVEIYQKNSFWITNKVKDTGSVLVKLYLLLDLRKKIP